MTSTTDTPTVFIHGSHWILAERTASGFKHTRLGTTIRLHDRDLAVAEALEVIGRR